MATLIDKLNSAIQSKEAIKAAIIDKGVTDVGNELATYADKIASIPVGSSSGGTAKTIVDNYIKINYGDNFTIPDTAVVGLKATVRNIEGRTSPDNYNYSIKGYVGMSGVSDGYIQAYSDYSSTSTYIKSICSSSLPYTFKDLSLSYSTQEIKDAIVVIPEYGVFLNLSGLLTTTDSTAQMISYLDRDNNAIYMFPCIRFTQNGANSGTMPLFAFDQYNQSNGGTAIDWTKVFPTSGVTYGSLT